MSSPEGTMPATEYSDQQRAAAQELARLSLVQTAHDFPEMLRSTDPSYLVGEARGEA